MPRSTLAAATALVLSLVLVAWTRPVLFETAAKVKERTSVYTLPSPSVLEKLSLGYKAALADYLWAHVLVTQGLRMGQRRPFPEMGDYVDAINHLAPRFHEPYRMIDSIMSFQVKDPDREATLLRVRGILERGLKVYPLDPELWLNYGQFLAYIAPGSLKDVALRKQWREDGARALVRAGELGGHDPILAFHSISAASILTRKGERDAAIRFLERAYTLTEDDDMKEDILRRLRSLQEDERKSAAIVLTQSFDRLWRRDLPFASRSMLSVLGPPVSVWKCAGGSEGQGTVACVDTWAAWSKIVLDRQRTTH